MGRYCYDDYKRKVLPDQLDLAERNYLALLKQAERYGMVHLAEVSRITMRAALDTTTEGGEP